MHLVNNIPTYIMKMIEEHSLLSLEITSHRLWLCNYCVLKSLINRKFGMHIVL